VRRARYKGGLYEGKRGKALRVVGDDESTIRSAITQFLDLRYVIHAVTDARLVITPTGKTRCVWPAGWPDITALLPITGQLWAIEVKTETGGLRDSQLETLPLIKASGGLVTVARDTLIIREIINRHYEQFTPAEIDEHRRRVRELREEAARRELEREIAKRAAGHGQAKRTSKRLNKAVDSDGAGLLFE
jgi:hypothetical protein